MIDPLRPPARFAGRHAGEAWAIVRDGPSPNRTDLTHLRGRTVP